MTIAWNIVDDLHSPRYQTSGRLPSCLHHISYRAVRLRNVYLQVLLELSDAELEAGLGVTHPLHRKKLRLAIEEHRHPSHVRYPCIAQLGHTWVSSEWLPDLGLAQYSESFATNMVDARMLDHLSKKELEKLLGVTRKFHQASIVHGIHLLRMLNYDRQVSEVTFIEVRNIMRNTSLSLAPRSLCAPDLRPLPPA